MSPAEACRHVLADEAYLASAVLVGDDMVPAWHVVREIARGEPFPDTVASRLLLSWGMPDARVRIAIDLPEYPYLEGARWMKVGPW